MYRFLIICSLFLISGATYAQQWEQIGWRGGSVQVIAQSDNVIYGAGSYKSTDWGKTWKLFRDGLSLSGANTTKMYEQNGRVYLAAAFGNANPMLNRFWYTSASDSTWHSKQFTPPSTWLNTLDVTCLHFFTDDSIAATYIPTTSDSSHLMGVYCSFDGGNTWERRMASVPLPAGYIDVRLRRQGQRLFLNIISYTVANAIYKSDDFGLSWQSLALPPLNDDEISVINDSLLLLQPLFHFSSDRGESWFAAPSPLPNANQISSAIVPLNQRTQDIILSIRIKSNAPRYQLFRSSDNGRSWNRFFTRDSNFGIGSLFGDSTVFIVTDQKTGTMQYTTTPEFKILEPLVPGDGLLNGKRYLNYVNDKGLFTANSTSDSITQWADDGQIQQTLLLNKYDALDNARWVRSGGTIYAAGRDTRTQFKYLYKSDDNGLNWKIRSSLPTSTPIDSMFMSDSLLIIKATILDSSVFYSSDLGLTWSLLPVPFVASTVKLTISYGAGIFLLYLHNDNRQYISTDWGASWKILSLPLTTNLLLSTTAIAGGRILCSATYSDTAKYFQLHLSNDSGRTWTESTAPKNDRHLLPVAFEQGALFAISYHTPPADYQLHYSLDTGSTWHQLGDSVTGASRFFIGSDYYFLAGEHALWRLPKQPLSIKAIPHEELSLDVYPNPATDKTTITYSLPHGSTLDLSVYDLLGRKHAKLASGISDGDEHTVQWNAEHVTPGMYVVRLVTSEGSATRMLQVIR